MTPEPLSFIPKIRRAGTSTMVLALVFVSVVTHAPRASADLARTGSTVLVSTFPDGTPADGGEPSVSAEGRYVAFASWDKLVPEARDNCQSVYRKDMVTGDLLLLTAGICSSYLPSISADGNKVLYVRGFCNRGFPNYCSGSRAYVRDIAAGTTVQVSDSGFGVGFAKLSSDGNYAVVLSVDGWDVWAAEVVDARVNFEYSSSWFIATLGLSVPDFTADISGDGRYVVFESEGRHSSLDTDFSSGDVYLFDRVTGAITLAGIHPSGEVRHSRTPSISVDGAYVSFVSSDAQGVEKSFRENDIWVPTNVYRRQLATGATTLVSQSSVGVPMMHGTLWLSMSGDGSRVLFDTLAPHLTADTNPGSDVFLRDIPTNKTSLVSVLPSGLQAAGYNQRFEIADGGTFVVFESRPSPRLPYERRVYLRNLQTPCGLPVCPLDYP